ncbi:MAG: SGNH/GDSL hydrolase family protein, partial [Elusimicrobia bacterium]|nr:SGNH/GDSL hydrolase family protein [Elusimicrobiota bacterium]
MLEIALRLAGTGVKRSHRVHQEFLLQRSDEGLVILCLGESTTYRQYPVQLQRMFDDRHGKAAVNVIDAGIPGTTISDITKNLRSNLEKFNPDVVIVMAGINDYADVIARNFPQSRFARLLWHNFKTFRLLSLIRSHLSFICESRVLGGKSDDNFTFTSDYICWSIAPHREYMYEASTLMSAGRFAEAYTIFIKALEIKPDCRHALRNSMLLTSDGKKQRDIALYAVNNF